jgi:glycerophosphoryl diester phosphodiesterase
LINPQHIYIHGHRGARGLYPENTITAFIEAVKLGVDAIEMDVVISKDNQVVVSHEPYMNALFCSTPDGIAIDSHSEKQHNLYHLTYAQIKQYDCGKRGNELFPQQKKVSEHKPLLSEVVKAVDVYTQLHNLLSIHYNIEIKSELEDDAIFQPTPVTFVNLVYDELIKLKILPRTILQSFDVRILQALKIKDTTLTLSYLVENKDSLEINLDRLGFMPNIYAPEFILINEQLISELKNKNIKLITWTVNEINDMKRLINMGVETLITDYPDKAITYIQNEFNKNHHQS